MLIDLKTIDDDGLILSFDDKSKELQGVFSDLIEDRPFKIQIGIRLLGNTYQVVGSIDSHYSENCSQCGFEIEVPLNNKINEIVVIEKARPRNTQVSQTQQNFDSNGPSVTYINHFNFDLKEFLHEMMAAEMSMYPRCEDAQLCESRQFKQEDLAETKTKFGHAVFTALKDFKIKH